jgi:hypothetical protein
MKQRKLAALGWGGRRHRVFGVDKDACALLSGLGLGACLMYFLDGHNGKRRRKLVADTLGSWARQGASAVDGASKDAGNRLKGVAHQAARRVRRSEPASGGQPALQGS